MPSSAAAFPATRAAALARLAAFVPSAPGYGEARNRVALGHPAVSRLSPAIRHRLILEAEAAASLLEAHAFPAVEKCAQEIVWRTYWKGWLELRPQVWTDFKTAVAGLHASLPKATMQRAADVAAGRSGVALMDAFARELAATGYLHNHARMWWASFWIHVERLPWELGADHFRRHLLDADPAANTLSWRWVAGLQTPGKTYLVRRSNLAAWCDPALLADPAGLDRLDDAVVSAVPLPAVRPPAPAPLAELPAAAPADSARSGLWLHEDDTLPEFGPLAGLRPASIAAFAATGEPDAELSLPRRAHRAAVRADACARAAAAFDCPAAIDPAVSFAEGFGAWIDSAGLRRVVALAPAVGPVADLLPAARAVAADRGVELVLVRRAWDRLLFPLARAGFFPFWENVRPRLAAREAALFS